MTEDQLRQCWDRNADAWTELSRAGYDICRDGLNTPAFLSLLPDVRGLIGLDIGCGEGTNTRRVAALGAKMAAIDISSRFIAHAEAVERNEPLGIRYSSGSACALPFADASFDFAVGFMSLMDVCDQPKALAEACRVIKPGGFLQFSITHPCFDTPYRRNLRSPGGQTYAIEVGKYFDRVDGRIDRWLFTGTPQEIRSTHQPFEVPRFNRTISEWFNTVLDAGFVVERVAEPRASEQTARETPDLQDTRVVAYFLHVRCRRPATSHSASQSTAAAARGSGG
jgi:ubiquinone/menaquinone biosynthesis C-methylase UbiE